MKRMTSSFRQRSASALTYPVTVAAVAALLLNDLLFKLLWPGHWATGKLSDLAWVVFAPPLLALLLSLLTFRKPLPERAAFAAAYAGLPLAYLIFNSSEAVHQWALSALLPLTGSATGSPFDPTDSLVILPALALALWVWRQTPARPESVRMRLYLFAAIAMALATIATSVDPPSQSQWLVGISDMGTVVMEGPSGEQYESDDGGITWVEVPRDKLMDAEWGSRKATTPRGTYAIRGFDIVLLRPEEQSTVVYSASYLQEETNRWAQKYSSRHLRSPLSGYFDGEDLESLVGQMPFNIVYDTRSANVIVAMGLEGALIGTPDGAWERIGVGQFVPTDFSFGGKARLMLSTHFWATALTVSLSCIALAFVWLAFATAGDSRVHPCRVLSAVLLAIVGTYLSTEAFPLYGNPTGFESAYAIAGLCFAICAAAIFHPRLSELPAYGIALVFTQVIAPLPFLLWLAGRVSLEIATVNALVLMGLVAGVLYQCLVKQRKDEADAAPSL